MPTCYGIIVSSVPKEMQSASSAFSQIFFNITGFFLAPNISGLVMDSFQDHIEGLLWGYRLVLAWNAFTVLFLAGAMYFSYRRWRMRQNNPAMLNEEEPQSDSRLTTSEEHRLEGKVNSRDRLVSADDMSGIEIKAAVKKRMRSMKQIQP